MVLSLWVPPPSNVQPSPSFVKVPSFLSEELPLPPLCVLWAEFSHCPTQG